MQKLNTLKKLVPQIARQYRLTNKEVDALISTIQTEIAASLRRGEVFAIGDIGRFSVKHKKARPGRNPATGELLHIPAHNSVAFKASSTLLDFLNDK